MNSQTKKNLMILAGLFIGMVLIAYIFLPQSISLSDPTAEIVIEEPQPPEESLVVSESPDDKNTSSEMAKALNGCMGVDHPFDIYKQWKSPSTHSLKWVLFLSQTGGQRHRFDFENKQWRHRIFEAGENNTTAIAEETLPAAALPQEYLPEDQYQTLKEEIWTNQEQSSIRLISRDETIEEIEIKDSNLTFLCQKNQECRCNRNH